MTYTASMPTSVDLSNTPFSFLINCKIVYEYKSIELNTPKTGKHRLTMTEMFQVLHVSN